MKEHKKIDVNAKNEAYKARLLEYKVLKDDIKLLKEK